MPHVSQRSSRDRGPYSYFHRIGQDAARPYAREPVVNRLLGHTANQSLGTLYARRAQQLTSEYVYPLMVTEGEIQASTDYPERQSIDLTQPDFIAHPASSEAMQVVKSGRSLTADGQSPGLEGRFDLPSAGLETDGNSQTLRANTAIEPAGQQNMPLIDWLEQAQARLPFDVLDENVDTEPSADPDTGGQQDFEMPSEHHVFSEQTLTKPQANFVRQRSSHLHDSPHSVQQQTESRHTAIPVDSTRKTSQPAASHRQTSKIDIAVPGSASSPSTINRARAGSPDRSMTDSASSQRSTGPAKPKSPSGVPDPVVSAVKQSSVQTDTSVVSPIDHLSTASTQSRTAHVRPQSMPIESRIPTKETAQPASNRTSVRPLARLQQALQNQSRLMQAESQQTDVPAQTPAASVAPSTTAATTPQAPQTIVVQRTVSAPGLDYAFLERSYSCRLGPRGYR